jgi:Flp pilus assembly protein TadG
MRRGLRRLRRFGRHAGGAAALEYALVLPLFALMLMGCIWSGMLMFSVNSLEMAVESAARCAAVNTSRCGSATSTQSYAMTQYAGPAISPVFTLTKTNCGHTVTGRATFDFAVIPGVGSVPLTVSACYP